jgi:hypothetical protein
MLKVSGFSRIGLEELEAISPYKLFATADSAPISYSDVHLEAFGKVQKYSALWNRLNPQQLIHGNVGNLLFFGCNFAKSFVHNAL